MVAIILAAAGWHYLPIYYARFYLGRSALQTQGMLKELWGSEREMETRMRIPSNWLQTKLT
ncbi:hypothetical protein [Lacrimispora xylanisolvens]|uniref:hypothetical protein n=1 Tax=Lacrimispora xylanisolvens TaxID=384636 RepID=UPI00240280AA